MKKKQMIRRSGKWRLAVVPYTENGKMSFYIVGKKDTGTIASFGCFGSSKAAELKMMTMDAHGAQRSYSLEAKHTGEIKLPEEFKD